MSLSVLYSLEMSWCGNYVTPCAVSETHETIEAAVLEHLANTHLVYHPTDDDHDDEDDDINWE